MYHLHKLRNNEYIFLNIRLLTFLRIFLIILEIVTGRNLYS